MDTNLRDIYSSISEHLIALYGNSAGRATFEQLSNLLERYLSASAAEKKPTVPLRPLTERDALLITYGDQVLAPGEMPLRSLADFCKRYLDGLVSGLHLLPFFPYSSDDGFSIIEYRNVNPTLGSWEDVIPLRRSFRLMFDAVINHVSVRSDWFQDFLRGDPRYQSYFIIVDDDPDLSLVVRPRTSPLLTHFETTKGTRQIWTTFSADQVDLNYHNPQVLLEIIDLLLFYVAHGAQLIRLDAVAYLWKEIGSSCIHRPQTHCIIQLLRSVLDIVAPQVLLITETNVSHLENLSYFGDGYNEAQLVYNFALSPLILHTLHSGSAQTLADWAAELKLPSDHTTFFNFLASHDGIGINAARGILSEAEIDALVERSVLHGGLISYKQNIDGSRGAYELNINYFDALSAPDTDEPLDIQVSRFLSSQAIMLAMVGIPGIYFHSLFGSRGWPEGAAATGRNRAINRQKLELDSLQSELFDPDSLRSLVFSRYAQMLRARAASPAFHPYGRQRILNFSERVFAVLRLSPEGGHWALCLHNVSPRTQTITLAEQELPDKIKGRLQDIITGKWMTLNRQGALTLRPYQSLWLIPYQK